MASKKGSCSSIFGNTAGVWPSGLNAVVGGTGGRYIEVPMMDVFALCSIGFKLDAISRILTKVYKRNIPPSVISRRISQTRFKSFEGLQQFFMKQVLELLIKDEADFNLEIDLVKALLHSDSTLHRKIKDWFKGEFSFLKLMVRKGNLDFSKVEEFEKDYDSLLRGYSLEQWKKWAYEEISAVEMGKLTGFAAKTIRNSIPKISHLLVGISNLNLLKLRREARKQKAVELLGKGIDPKVILERYFKMTILYNYMLRSRYEYIFDMPYEQVIQPYLDRNLGRGN